MTHKITVGLQQKIGQPNFSSVGASCSIEVQLDDDEVSCPELITGRVKQAFAQCRASIAQELESHTDSSPRYGTSSVPERKPVSRSNASTERPVPNGSRSTRMASEAQIRAIHAIASKCGLSLASELKSRFGVDSPSNLSIREASQLIDSLKQSLSPTTA